MGMPFGRCPGTSGIRSTGRNRNGHRLPGLALGRHEQSALSSYEMIEFDIIYSDTKNPTEFTREDIADFLYEHLDRYGDRKEHILACIGYAYGDEQGQDGFVLIAHEKGEIAGVVIINDTGMGGYIPEHMLVYIAVHKEYRGRGLGSRLMERVIEKTGGDIALHVEKDNPAKHLYEKYGFTNKYLEMRLNK